MAAASLLAWASDSPAELGNPADNPEVVDNQAASGSREVDHIQGDSHSQEVVRSPADNPGQGSREVDNPAGSPAADNPADTPVAAVVAQTGGSKLAGFRWGADWDSWHEKAEFEMILSKAAISRHHKVTNLPTEFLGSTEFFCLGSAKPQH
jgi:hypothetical protein